MTSEEGEENTESITVRALLNGHNPPMTHVPAEVLKEFVPSSNVDLKRNSSSLEGEKISEGPLSPIQPESNPSNMQLTQSEFPCNSTTEESSKKSLLVTPDSEDSTHLQQENSSSNEKASKKPRLDDEMAESLKPETKTSTPSSNGTAKAFNSSLLLGKSSSSVSLTPKLAPTDQSKKSSVTIESPKPPSPNSTQFSSSVSLTVKIPNSSSFTKETPLLPRDNLPKRPASPESLSDLEKKIVGSVSISPKVIEKESKADNLEDANNDEELLCPSSPFSDTSSHISLSLEESLLRDEDVIFNKDKLSEEVKDELVDDDVFNKSNKQETSEDLDKANDAKRPTNNELEASQNLDTKTEDNDNSDKNLTQTLDKVKEKKNDAKESVQKILSEEINSQIPTSKTENKTEEGSLSDKDDSSSSLKPTINKLVGSLDNDSKHSNSNGSTITAHVEDDTLTGSEKDAFRVRVKRVSRKDSSSSSSDASSTANLEMDVSEEDSVSNSSHGAKSKGNENSSSSRSSISQSSSNKSKKSNKPQGQSLSKSSSSDKISKESAQTNVPKSNNNLDNSTTEPKANKFGSSTKSSGGALTFTEALKSMEAEEDVQFQLKNKPEPLKPTVELISDEFVNSSEKSLTVLQPVSTSKNGAAPSLKRSISQVTTATRPKTDLKKIRVFDATNKETGNKELDIEASTRILSDMEQWLKDDKSKDRSNDAKRIPMDDVNPEELRRRTALELENSKAKSQTKLKRIKRKDLESLVTELFIEKVLYEHELGQQRDLCKRLEATLETNRKKAAQFHKEVEDLKKVTQRLQAEHIARKGQVVAPVKVKRSVGIQATPNIIGKGLMHASSANNSIKLMAPSTNSTNSTNSTTSSPPTSPPPAANQVRKWAPVNPQLSPTQPSSLPESNHSSYSSKVTQTLPYLKTKEISHESSNLETQGGKFRALLPARNVVSVATTQATLSPLPPISTGQMVVVNAPQQIMVSQGGVASMTQLNAGARFVRAPIANVGTSSPLNNQTIGQQVITTTVPASKVAGANLSGSGFIDLTDDEEGTTPKPARLTASTGVLVPRNAAGIATLTATTNSSGQQQYVAFQQVQHSPTVSQLVLLPNSSGSATLLVGNMAANGQTIVSGPATSVMRPNILSSNVSRLSNTGPGNVINTTTATRVVVAQQQMNGGTLVQNISPLRHPAPLPRAPAQQTSGVSKKLPPVPILKLSHKDNSIVLSWNMNKTEEHETISSYQLYAYQEGTAAPTQALWKKVGSVKALELPMACTLTQFMPGHVYHFAVRAVDTRCRLGPFSEAKSIRLGKLS